VGLLWPGHAKPEPTFSGRLGRLLHWVSLGLAAMWTVMATVIALEDGASANNAVSLIACLGLAALAAIIGRGLRYLVAGE
jgi:hypothetical protein